MFRWLLPAVVVGVVVLGCGRVAEHTGSRGGGADGGASADAGASNTYTSVLQTKGIKNIDLLFVIENSPSMADKQAVLTNTIPDLVQRLVNPPCVDDVAADLEQAAPDPTTLCPAHSHRAIIGAYDFHVGVITTSLGGKTCPAVDGMSLEQEEADDHAHLVATRPRFAAAWNANPGALPPTPEGFLVFDTVSTSLTAFNASFQAMTAAAGEHGCDVQAPLEAAYRFLADTAPLTGASASCLGNGAPCTGPVIDDALLSQRSAFLRPDSAVAIVFVADGDDHSMSADGTPYPTARYVNAFSNERVCTSRADLDARASCPDLDGDGRPDVVDNPLFSGPSGVPRDKSLLFVAGIVGVPYQDIRSDIDEAGEPYDTSSLHYRTASQLQENDTWKTILGVVGPDGVAVPPTDALMIESTTPRTGFDGETPPRPLAPPEAGYVANPVNGHEWRNPGNADPQYACIFRLPLSRDCAVVASGPEPHSACDCTAVVPGDANPLCQDDSGAYTTIQRFGKAYPSLRELTVLQHLGNGAVVASMCSRNLVDVTRQDYGYRPVLDPIVARFKQTFPGECLPNAIAPLPDLDHPGKTVAPCTVTEARPNPDGSIHCDPSRGRFDVPPESIATVFADLRAQGVCDGDGQAPCATYSLCRIQESDASCHMSGYPGPSTPPGWCFVDPDDVSTDNPALVDKCPVEEKRALIFVDPRWDTPVMNDARVLVTCSKRD